MTDTETLIFSDRHERFMGRKDGTVFTEPMEGPPKENVAEGVKFKDLRESGWQGVYLYQYIREISPPVPADHWPPNFNSPAQAQIETVEMRTYLTRANIMFLAGMCQSTGRWFFASPRF